MSDQRRKFMQAAHLWAAASWSDGVLSLEEKAGMGIIVKAANLDEADRAKVTGWFDNPVSLDDLDLSDVATDEQKAEVYLAAARIVGMDAQIVDGEKVFLARLREALAIDDAMAAELHAQIPGFSA